MRRFGWLSIGLVLSGSLLGCGDDDGNPTDAGTADSGPPMVVCPTSAPNRDSMMGACCYRRSNADRLDAVELRIAGFDITAPTTLASPIVDGLLDNALDTEVFNWLIRFEMTGTDVAIKTGYGQPSPDSTFAFTTDAAPGPGPSDRWNAVDATGTLTGETVTGDRLDDSFTVPIFEEDGTTLQLELPLNNLLLETAVLSEDRSCVGTRRPTSYDTMSGAVQGYVTVEAADAGRVVVGTITSTLCMFASGMSGEQGSTCADIPRTGAAPGACDTGSDDPCRTSNGGPGGTCADVMGTPTCRWPSAPDSLCTGSSCQKDPGDGTVCDPYIDCNAWRIEANFAAHGVEITN